jgi:rhomboid protease GluP
MEEITPGDVADVVSFDSFAWPLCAVFDEVGGGWLAPQIPQPILVAAVTTYLDLAEDEILLAILCTQTSVPAASCALTTKRIYWPGAPRRADAEWIDPDHPSATPDISPPARCEYLAYKDLPEVITRTGVISKEIDLGEGRKIDLGGHVPLTDALIAYLREVRSLVRGEKPLPVLEPEVHKQANSTWPAVVAANAEARTLQTDMRRFGVKTTAASRGVVTPLLAAACVLVYLAMIVRGLSPFEPESKSMIEWGAIFGPPVVFDGEVWRLPASMFLHFGLVHLAMNLWCLLSTGAVVERFFGHLGYTAIYVLSGLGGAIASLCAHPTSVCAGASGAIFGVIGGLLAYLAVRHHDVPAAILQPMRSGTLGFLGYNLVFGMTSPTIDMAAHLGGLVTGFIAGLILAGSWVTRADGAGLVRRSGVIVALSLGLALLAHQGLGVARERLLADPQFGPLVRAEQNAAPAFNEFARAADPLLQQLDRISQEVDRLLRDHDRGNTPAAEINLRLDRLIADANALGPRFATIPAQNDEIRAISERLASAQKHQVGLLSVIKRALETDDPKFIEGPGGLRELSVAYGKDLDAYVSLRDAYFKAHGLQVKTP